MPVNRGSVLSKEYFLSYFKLVMNARNFNKIEGKDFIIESFFRGDKYSYGEATCRQFELAFQEVEEH
ncbi:hypothetical protein GCM10008967_03060 [Bacillus carboniphilus]|uniref:Uncharacterized protein n=1 Tax=Bacillus carboniphilus TaxID=86663 RepID=A0ABN0VS26_9BACI